MIELTNITFSYDDKAVLFENLSLQFNPGDFYIITGDSGTGKSTLLRLINRLEEPRSGEIRYNGTPIKDIAPPLLRKKILYLQQEPVVQEGSVKHNLLLPFKFNVNKDLDIPDDPTLKDYLQQFRLTTVSLNDTALSLSTGQLQRLCFIRGLLLSPSVVLLDEPTSSLDNTSRQIVEKTSEDLCLHQGKTVIMVSHRQFSPVSVTPVEIDISTINQG